MTKITADDFKKAVGLDPTWAEKLIEPVEITEFCDMDGSNITHLSPLLHFTGKDELGFCASFQDCENLETAAGNFRGAVSFQDSGVRNTDQLNVQEASLHGLAANLSGCKRLESATGRFPGTIDLSESGIKSIHNLTVSQPDVNGTAAYISHCENLTSVEGTFAGKVDLSGSGIRSLEGISITQPNARGEALELIGCLNLTSIKGSFPGHVDIRKCAATQIELDIANPNRTGAAVQIQGCQALEHVTGTFKGTFYMQRTSAQTIEVNTKQKATRPGLHLKNCDKLLEVHGNIQGNGHAREMPQLRKFRKFDITGELKLKDCPNITFVPPNVLDRTTVNGYPSQELEAGVRRAMETAERKNRAVEIQID